MILNIALVSAFISAIVNLTMNIIYKEKNIVNFVRSVLLDGALFAGIISFIGGGAGKLTGEFLVEILSLKADNLIGILSVFCGIIGGLTIIILNIIFYQQRNLENILNRLETFIKHKTFVSRNQEKSTFSKSFSSTVRNIIEEIRSFPNKVARRHTRKFYPMFIDGIKSIISLSESHSKFFMGLHTSGNEKQKMLMIYRMKIQQAKVDKYLSDLKQLSGGLILTDDQDIKIEDLDTFTAINQQLSMDIDKITKDIEKVNYINGLDEEFPGFDEYDLYLPKDNFLNKKDTLEKKEMKSEINKFLSQESE